MSVRMLKVARNMLSDSVALAVVNLPVFEGPYIFCGRVVNTIPVMCTLYRRGNETLVRKLQQRGRQHRAIRILDVEFTFDISDFTVDAWFFKRQLFEPQTTEHFLEYLKPGMTFVDVGANRGYFSILAALRVGENGRVFSFEPNPAVRADLDRHIQMNNVSNRVSSCSEALSNCSDQDVTFYVSCCGRNSGLSSLAPSAEMLKLRRLSPDHTIAVRTVTLDEYVGRLGLAAPFDLIKIDVEGAELLVLQGAERTLLERPPRRWIVETEPGSAACRLLRSHGYREEHFDPAGDKVNAVFTHPSV